MSLLEAMSYNCSCLVSDIPENKEVGKTYVQYFESKNTESLKQKLIESLKNDEFGKNDLKKYIRENYSWDFVVDQTLQLYSKIIR